MFLRPRAYPSHPSSCPRFHRQINGVVNWEKAFEATLIAIGGGAAAYILSYLMTKLVLGRGYLPMGMEESEAEFRQEREQMHPMLGRAPAQLLELGKE